MFPLNISSRILGFIQAGNFVFMESWKPWSNLLTRNLIFSQKKKSSDWNKTHTKDLQHFLTSTQVNFIYASKFDHTGQISHFELLAHECTKQIQVKVCREALEVKVQKTNMGRNLNASFSSNHYRVSHVDTSFSFRTWLKAHHKLNRHNARTTGSNISSRTQKGLLLHIETKVGSSKTVKIAKTKKWNQVTFESIRLYWWMSMPQETPKFTVFTNSTVIQLSVEHQWAYI